MVTKLVKQYGLRDERVLAALERVPRHLFVPEHLVNDAYSDRALPIGCEQTISQPYIVARMTAELEVRDEDSVLEIGTGSGYQTAILATLARRVYSIERVGQLARQAIGRIQALGLPNVKIQVFDGTVGWSSAAPFDRILVAAAAPRVPEALLDQLAPGGRLVIPEGDQSEQRLINYRKHENGVVTREAGEPVRFVPLIGRHGWKPKEATS
jgi:protein-L-isoaspartate(D-aspartate) O-methyltransferase